MVNAEATSERRARERRPAAHAARLGETKLNPFGDLHTLQHLSARLARALRGVFEPLLRREVRAWAEPLVVQRFGDYRAERADGLTAWLPLIMSPQGATGLCVLDGVFVLEMLDLFFGGTGAAPAVVPPNSRPPPKRSSARSAPPSPVRCAPPGSRWRGWTSRRPASR
jgi:flagellar motor switch protein FliM